MSLTLSGPNPIGIAPGEKYSGWRDAMDGLGWVAGKRYPKTKSFGGSGESLERQRCK